MSSLKISFLKVNNAGAYVQINSLRPPVCEISSFKSISAINLTSDLESQGHILFPMVESQGHILFPMVEIQGHILFPMVDFVDLHINSL